MARLLGTEILLMLLTGLFAMAGVPLLLGHPPVGSFFIVGLLMALSFVALYSLTNLAGRSMPGPVRILVGLLSWAAAFWPGLVLAAGLLARGDGLTWRTAHLNLAPALYGLLLPALAALRARPGGRGEAAAWALYAYAFPMTGVRWALVPLVQINPVAQVIALQAGAVYLALRVAVRILLPTAAEGNLAAGPLVSRPVPDRIVGLVEAKTRRTAYPYATRPDGSRDPGAISIRCRPDDLPGVTRRLAEALAEQPFTVAPGQEADGQVEVVIRPALTTEPTR